MTKFSVFEKDVDGKKREGIANMSFDNSKLSLKCGCCALLMSGAALWGPAPVFAQSADQPGASASGLEEIVVTARRHEEKLQSVPIAITAFSEDSLQQKSITAVQDLQYSVPSLSVLAQNRDEANFNLRGIGGGPIG